MPLKFSKILLLTLTCVALILVAGCTSTAPSAGAVTTPMTTAITAAATATPVVIAAPETIVTTALSVTPATTTATPDPILHRWVRIVSGTDPQKGYEWKFYPDSTVAYNYGSTKMTSSNIVILTPVDMSASGTWSKIGENKYLVKVLPTGETGAQIIREYTLVPAHEDPAYPGIIIRDHIESSFETDQINKGQARRYDEMYYPEKAKID
jgi:hypothetical protein